MIINVVFVLIQGPLKARTNHARTCAQSQDKENFKKEPDFITAYECP